MHLASKEKKVGAPTLCITEYQHSLVTQVATSNNLMDSQQYALPEQLLSVLRSLPTHISLEPLQLTQNPPPSPTVSSQPSFVTQRQKHRSGPKKVGRKVSQVNQVLRAFHREQTVRTYQPPKLENVRYRVMRTLKKVLRRLSKGKPPGNKGLLAIDFLSERVIATLHRLEEYAAYYADVIREFCEVSNGPKVDKGRFKRDIDSQFFTYNNSYMLFIFSKPKIRIVYRLFLDLVFADDVPESLNSRFSIWCCTHTEHDDTCRQKWSAFREMLHQYLGTNLPEEIRTEKFQRLLESV